MTYLPDLLALAPACLAVRGGVLAGLVLGVVLLAGQAAVRWWWPWHGEL